MPVPPTFAGEHLPTGESANPPAPTQAQISASKNEFADDDHAAAIDVAVQQFPNEFEAAPRSLPELPNGIGVKDFDGQYSARLDTATGHPAGVLESSVPLTADVDGEHPIDLRLHRSANGFEATAATAPVVLATRADQVSRIGDVGFRPTPAANVPGSLVNGRITYPSIGEDVDFIAEPRAGGAESFWQLRSALSAEELGIEFELPSGASLSEREVPGAGHAYQIVKDGQILEEIPPLQAVDAAGKAIPIETTLDGAELRIHVHHRSADALYPILVDPITENYSGASWAGNDAQCGDGQSSRWSWGSNVSSFGHTCNLQLWGTTNYGLWIGASGTNAFGAGWWGQYVWQAPAGAYIQQFGLGDVQFQNSYYTNLYAGLYQGGGWQRIANNPNNMPAQNWGFVAPNSAPGNAAVLGMSFQATTAPSSAGTLVSARSASMVLDDNIDPTTSSPAFNIGMSGSSTSWINATTGTVTYTATGSDSGFGVNSLGLQASPGGSNLVAPTTYNCTGSRFSPCAASQRPGTMMALNTGLLGEGSTPALAVARDANGNVTHAGEGSAITIRKDTVYPSLAIESRLWDDRADNFEPETFYVGAGAEDATSGVRSIGVYIDGTLVTYNYPTPCAGGCDLETDPYYWKATTGAHTIKVSATDIAGNQTVQQWSITVASASATAVRPVVPASPAVSGTGGGCPPATTTPQVAGEEPVTSLRNGYWTTGGGAAAGETTWFLQDGSYDIFRCDPHGELVVSQHVEPVTAPNTDQLMVATEETLPDGGPGQFVTEMREAAISNQAGSGSASGGTGSIWTGADSAAAVSDAIPPTQ